MSIHEQRRKQKKENAAAAAAASSPAVVPPAVVPPVAAETKPEVAPVAEVEAKAETEKAPDEPKKDEAEPSLAEALRIPVVPPPAHIRDAHIPPDPVEEIRNNLRALAGPIATAQASLAAVDPRTTVGRTNLGKLGCVIANGEIKMGRVTLPSRETRVLVISAPQAGWLTAARLLATPGTGKFSVLSVLVGADMTIPHRTTIVGSCTSVVLAEAAFVRRGEAVTVRLRNDTPNPVTIEGIAEADFLVDDGLWLDLVDKGTALAPLAAVLGKL